MWYGYNFYRLHSTCCYGFDFMKLRCFQFQWSYFFQIYQIYFLLWICFNIFTHYQHWKVLSLMKRQWLWCLNFDVALLLCASFHKRTMTWYSCSRSLLENTTTTHFQKFDAKDPQWQGSLRSRKSQFVGNLVLKLYHYFHVHCINGTMWNHTLCELKRKLHLTFRI